MYLNCIFNECIYIGFTSLTLHNTAVSESVEPSSLTVCLGSTLNATIDVELNHTNGPTLMMSNIGEPMLLESTATRGLYSLHYTSIYSGVSL